MNTFYMWGICISSWWSGWSSKFFGLLIHQRRGDRAVGSGGLLLLLVLRKQLLCAFLSLIFLCGMMPFIVVGVLPTLEMQVSNTQQDATLKGKSSTC
jgi:hypothetical protein